MRLCIEFGQSSPSVERQHFCFFSDVAFGQSPDLGIDSVLDLFVLGLRLFKHIVVLVAEWLKEVFEHFGEESLQTCEPIEHADALGFVELDALRVVEVCRQFIEQVVLLCGEITLIEVIAHDERLKRHTLKLCVDCTVRANFSESDGQCRHAVEPVERMGGLFHLLGCENELQAVVLVRPEIAVTVQDF